MDDNKNILHDIGSVLAIVAYALLLIYYFKLLGLIISISTIIGFIIISKNVKAINDLLLKINKIVEKLKRISHTKILIWMTMLIVFVVLVLIIVYPPKPSGMEFVIIPAGEFDMGSSQNEAGRDIDEGPVHHVKIADAFNMSKYEITQKQWHDVMGTYPSYFRGDNLPVEQVSWNEVQEFISRLNEKEGINKYRLPSEAEWEYAARAGTTTRYYFGDDVSKLSDYEWYDVNSERETHEVGQKKPNPWGLYDMHGNVWEWVQDVYHDSYIGSPIDGSPWEGNGSHRVIRGGSFDYYAGHLRAANRNDRDPGYRHYSTGFRLVRDL